MSGASGAHRDQRRRSPRVFLVTSDLKVQDQLEGTIRLDQGHMCLEMPESAGGRDQVWVKVIDNGLMVKIERHFLMEVPNDVCGLLEPVTDPGTRFNLLINDPGKLQRLAAVPLGTRLWAQIGQPDELAEAELRHRGPVTRGSSCVLFGVQLKGSAVGLGLSNGSYKGHQLFVCPEASALFLPVSHVHLRQWSACDGAAAPGAEPNERVRGEPRETPRRSNGGGGGGGGEPPRERGRSDGSSDRVRREEPRRSDGNGYPANNNHSQQSQNQPQPPAGRSPQHRSALQPLNRTADAVPLTAQGPTQGPAGSFQARGGPGSGPGSPLLFREGDRVCFPLENTVQGGEVRYCGPLPGRSTTAIYVGILLDAPVGNWDGFFKGAKLCHMPSPLYGELLCLDKVSHESKARQINPKSVLKALQLPPIPKPGPMSPQHVPKTSPATSPQHVPKPTSPHVPKPSSTSPHVPKPSSTSPHVPVTLRVALMPPQLGSPQPAAQRHAFLKAPPPLPPPKPSLRPCLPPTLPPPLPPPKPPQATPPDHHHHNHHHQSRPSNGTHGPPPPSSPLHSPAGNGGDYGEENGGGDIADLEAGSMVEVNDPPLFGVIRWIGRIGGVPELVAGIELDSELSAGTDGSYLGERHFRCPVNKGLFVKLRNCRRDSRFPAPETRVNQVERCNSIAFAEWGSERVEEHTPPMEQEDEIREMFCGWKRGIQGHLNSCYLDSTLFSLFSCCSAADWVLLYPMVEEDGDSLSSQAQDLLRCEIVNPLRRFGYVCASKTMALRRLLEADSTSDTGFTNQEKDPEEFLNRLFQLLQIEPLLKIRSTNQQPQEFHLYQLFPPPLPPSPPSPVSPPSSPLSPAPLPCPSPSAGGRMRVASVQTLLESSFHHAGLKFVEAPSCLLLLMPRFGRDFKMFDAILPSLLLDITDLLEDTLRQCSICQSVAEWECLQCYEDLDITPGRLKQYCHTCSTQVHSHRKRVSHAPQRVGVPSGPWASPGPPFDSRQRMALFAVTCIQTSHYVSFVKHGPRPQDWLFFDSMADREGGENGFNVPHVRACPEVGRYLSLSEEELSRVDPASLREPARRLLCDAHMCFYNSPELSLYK